jgi:hypothetical protein
MVRDALDAADLSHGTAQLAETLVLRVFARDAAWGATWLATLIKERGVLHNPRLGEQLSDDEVRAAGPQPRQPQPSMQLTLSTRMRSTSFQGWWPVAASNRC